MPRMPDRLQARPVSLAELQGIKTVLARCQRCASPVRLSLADFQCIACEAWNVRREYQSEASYLGDDEHDEVNRRIARAVTVRASRERTERNCKNVAEALCLMFLLFAALYLCSWIGGLAR